MGRLLLFLTMTCGFLRAASQRDVVGNAACPSVSHVVVKRSFSGQECSAHHMKRALSLREVKQLSKNNRFYATENFMYLKFSFLYPSESLTGLLASQIRIRNVLFANLIPPV